MSPRHTLIALYVLAALFGAGMVLVLDGGQDGAARVEPETAGAPLDERKLAGRLPLPLQPSLIETGAIGEAPVTPPLRLTFVAPEALPLRLESLVDEPSDKVESWSTEAHIESGLPDPAQRARLTKTEALPWQRSEAKEYRSASLQQKLAEIGPGATIRLAEKFKTAKMAWPPAAAALVAIKDQKALELHARGKDGGWTFIHSYKVLAASGKAGPKLIQGDKQVPEGVYGISFLNPNSKYHVALRVNYPNAFDREMAKKDGRKKLGGDIMIHGKATSAGCLAMGDEAAEELFVLAAETGLKNMKVVIAPADFRRDGLPKPAPGQPEWLPKLYTDVAVALTDFKPPPEASMGLNLLSLFGN